MTFASSSGPSPTAAGPADHQLGQRLRELIARQAASNLPFSAILSQLQDLLGADTVLLGPLRDLLGRPAFRQLTGLDQHSILVGARDALLEELALTYNAGMVIRLAAVIDGCMGLPPGPVPRTATAGGSTGAPFPPPPPPRPAPPSPASAPPPEAPASGKPASAGPSSPPPTAAPQPPQPAPPPAASGLGPVTALLIALVSMLSGAVLLGLGWLLFSNRPLTGTASAPAAAPSAPKVPVSEPPSTPPRAEAASPATPKESASESPQEAAGAWGSASDYKYGQLPGGSYPNSCAFSQTDPSGRVTTTNKSQLEFWACRDVGGDPENGYKVVWADGKETTYTFGPDGDGRVVGTNGSTYPMRWRNDSHQGDQIVVINHQDGAISWIPGNIN